MATAAETMAEIDKRMKADPSRFAEEVDGTYKFALTGDEAGSWIVNCKDDVGVTEGDGEADCTMELDSALFVGIADGSEDGMQAFMMGQIQVDGDMGLAMKLQTVLAEQ